MSVTKKTPKKNEKLNQYLKIGESYRNKKSTRDLRKEHEQEGGMKERGHYISRVGDTNNKLHETPFQPRNLNDRDKWLMGRANSGGIDTKGFGIDARTTTPFPSSLYSNSCIESWFYKKIKLSFIFYSLLLFILYRLFQTLYFCLLLFHYILHGIYVVSSSFQSMMYIVTMYHDLKTWVSCILYVMSTRYFFNILCMDAYTITWYALLSFS